MKSNKLAGNKIRASTQQYLDIAEIRDDTVVMKDGSLRAIILVSSINFALKSEEEQNSLVSAYVSFLNNIDFPLQIVIQSRELNIDGYIADLKKKEKEQLNELLKLQTAEYIQYVSELISIGKIMSKRFYVMVPYSAVADTQKKFFSRLFEVFKTATLIKMKDEEFAINKIQLQRRIENIMSGLSSMGLNSAVLDTQSIIELLYNSYNPHTSYNQKMVNIRELRIVE